MKTFSRVLILFATIFITSSLYAVPANPAPVTITQPDGSVLTIRMRGDEFYHYKTSLDGYALIKNREGVLTYAQPDKNGELISTKVKANNINRRSTTEKEFISKLAPNLNFTKQNLKRRSVRSSALKSNSLARKSYPLRGGPKSLVILVNFSNLNYKTATPQSSFTNLLNEAGYKTNGGTGSAKDYFRDNSTGVFIPEFEVVGPYTLPKNMGYYGNNDDDDNDSNPAQMIVDACTEADKAGLDFTQFDTDNDGVLDNVFVYYAGHNEAENAPDSTIWPHRWAVQVGSNYTGTVASAAFDGKRVIDYACTSELKNSSGSNMCGIGTFVHEFGHVLGLPDYYATGGESHHTLSSWNVMDSGPYLNQGRTPPSYSAFDRFFLNWLIPIEIKKAQNITLEALNTSNKAYLVTQDGNHNLNGANPKPLEFFTLENRQKQGWDAYLPGHGLLITRIFYNSSTWNDNELNNIATAMGVDIMEADGIASDNNLYGDPFPGTSGISSYSPTLRAGTDIGKPLTNIKEDSGIITFRFMGGALLPTITSQSNFRTFSTVQGTASEPQVITVSGARLKSGIQISFETSEHFEVKKESDTETAWTKTILLEPADSVVQNTNILIRYNPTEPSFASTHTETLILQSTNAETESIAMSGNSTRPVSVVTPMATEATEVTMGSFIANWDESYDATGYYLTVYNFSTGISEQTEGFDKGLTAPTDWTITAKTLSSSVNYSGKAIPAIQLVNTGEIIQTEKYLLPATNLSFYIRSLAGLNGNLKVEAWDEAKWNKVDSIPITSTLNLTEKYAFDSDNNYVQFRLTYTKSAGSIIIDDVTVGFSQKLEYNAHEKWVTGTSDTLINLVSSRDYFYKVKASDKTLNVDKTLKYENITGFSNLIQVRTLVDDSTNLLRVRIDTDRNITVIIPSTNVTINVFNIIGQKIRSITPTSNIVEIKDLPRGQAYILQAGKRRTKIIL